MTWCSRSRRASRCSRRLSPPPPRRIRSRAPSPSSAAHSSASRTSPACSSNCRSSWWRSCPSPSVQSPHKIKPLPASASSSSSFTSFASASQLRCLGERERERDRGRESAIQEKLYAGEGEGKNLLWTRPYEIPLVVLVYLGHVDQSGAEQNILLDGEPPAYRWPTGGISANIFYFGKLGLNGNFHFIFNVWIYDS